MWSSKVRWSSSIMPRYLVLFTRSVRSFPTVRWRSGLSFRCWQVPKITHFVSLALSVRRLAFSHSLTVDNLTLKFYLCVGRCISSSSPSSCCILYRYVFEFVQELLHFALTFAPVPLFGPPLFRLYNIWVFEFWIWDVEIHSTVQRCCTCIIMLPTSAHGTYLPLTHLFCVATATYWCAIVIERQAK